MFIFVVQTLQKNVKRNSHDTTSRWKKYGKRLFSEDLGVRDEGLKFANVMYFSFHFPLKNIS
jgi:hypothetical protein